MFIWLLGLILLAGAPDPPLGVGVVVPHQSLDHPLYFFDRPHDSAWEQHVPMDSLTFQEGPYHIVMDHVPSGFAPLLQKLDYQILFLQAKTLTSAGWIEVILNQETGEVAWVRHRDITFSTWEDFLLGVFAVEILDPASNRLVANPGNHAADVWSLAAERQAFRPLAIQGNWMRVAPMEDGQVDKDARRAWIRWRDEDRLLIQYALLS
ncbi:MAG TPA: hypothetical protein VKP65_14405 [Rhodothermales bacterium]|nr:hypothetical protein [Rhodothermales bacterium]